MVGELIKLPVRIGLRTASIAVRGSLYATERAYAVAEQVVRAVVPAGHDATTDGADPAPAPRRRPPGRSAPEPARPSAPEPAQSRPSAPEPAASGSGRAEPEPVPSDAEPEWEPTPTAPAHVSEEPELVEAFAEPGAEDGAGAELRIDEPWHGYSYATAEDVIARISGADSEELAAVQLYEGSHRKRETVLSAVERALRIKTAGRSGAADTTTKEQ